MDALTCAANNCYWWSDGTCHDTEEAPPISAYEECGRVPTSSDSKTYITDWWKCACGVAEKRGVCHSSWASWFNEVYEDIKVDLGVEPHMQGVTQNPDGDYIKIWMGHYPEIYLGRFKWKCAPVVGKFIINVPKGIFGPIGKGVVMVYKVHKLPFIDAYVGLGLPAKNFWCETPPCTFEVVGLEKGGKYAIFPSSSISVLPYVTSKCVYEFTDKVQTIDLPVYIDPLSTVLCDFFELTPSECAVFLMEFQDPIYVANTLSVIRDHEDIMGNPREPETLDYVMLPIVMVGSLLPVVPMGKISQWTGRGLKLAKKSAASKTFLIKHHQKIHHLTAVGDEARLLKFKAFFDADKLDDALKILNEGVTSSEATEAVKALKRANLRKWIRGIIAKWKKDNPKTTIEKLMDDTAEHGGNVFKTQADTIVKHVDEANSDWTKIRKIWGDTVKTADDVVYVDFHLAGKSDDVQVMHNIMRYSKDDFIKALKGEKAVVPEFANRFDEGVDFMLRHIGDETGTEVAKYRKVIKGLSDTDINNIVKNLDAAGQGNLARTIKTLKVAPERGMKYFDDVADALKGAKKFTPEERKALGAILDSGGDEAVKHLDAKWTNVFNKLFDTEDSIKNPQGRRFWDYIRGHGKTKDMMAKHGVRRFRDLPFYAKAAVFMGVFYVVNSAWKTMQDFCFALFMGEETIQWGGFGGIVLNNLLYKFNEKPLSEKKQIIKTFEKFSEKRHTIHDLVTGSSSIFESLCLVFGEIFKGFWEADAVNLWALDTTIEYLKKDINPYTGIGECSIKVRANKDGVDFWYQGSPTQWHGGKAFSWTEIKLVPVRATPEEVTILAWKPGYVMGEKTIKIFPEDVGKTGYNAKEMALFELIPESSVSDTPNPFGYQTPPDTTNLPPPYGNADPREYFGEDIHGSIRCESIPTGAGVYLDVKDTAHYKGKTDINLDHILVGTHKIIQTFPNFNDCVVNVNVVVEPMVYARCRFPTPTCSFTPSTTKPKLNEVVTFDASASSPGTGAASITYDWDWGDGKPHGTKKIETHAYTAKGVYAVKLTVTNEMGGSKVCTTNITVEVATGNIKCYCTPTEYCKRNADIFVDGNKVDVTKESGYTYIKNLTPGAHTVRYNLLDVMECSGYVTVTADKDVDFSCQLKSKLPASQTAKVTAIVDGDGIRTNITDALPVPSGQTHQTVRIVGYDAYECRIYPTDCTTFGKYAYDKLKRLIPIGTSITLKIDEWLPLGAHNRVIAGVFVGTEDIAAEMLKSCLVSITEKKYRYRYYWIPRTADGHWPEYERIWCDPTEAVASAEHKPTIIDIDIRLKTFKIRNNWLTLWLLAEFVDSGGSVIGRIPERQVEGGKTSSAITYFVGTHAIKLYARVDKKEDWTLVDTGYVAVAPPIKKTVTFKSAPSGASVRVVKKESARLVRALKRVRSKKVINV
jgi:PKD repeat protein